MILKKRTNCAFKNNGREWNKAGQPVQVKTHDFTDKNLGKVSPYGVYDLTQNKGWVSVGISYDKAEFAVESIKNCDKYYHQFLLV